MTGLIPPKALAMICAAQLDLGSKAVARIDALEIERRIRHGEPVGVFVEVPLRRCVAKIVARGAIDLLTNPRLRLRMALTTKARQLWQNARSISASR